MNHEAFRLHGPAVPAVPLVLDSPHSGLRFPSDFDAVVSELDLRDGEDCFVDQLYLPATELGIPLLAAEFPRTYLDNNRHAGDIDLELIEGGHWPHDLRAQRQGGDRQGADLAHAGRRPPDLRAPADGRRKRSARIERVHAPYHGALRQLMNAAHARFGDVFHINCHSMNSVAGKMGEGGEGIGARRLRARRPRPDDLRPGLHRVRADHPGVAGLRGEGQRSVQGRRAGARLLGSRRAAGTACRSRSTSACTWTRSGACRTRATRRCRRNLTTLIEAVRDFTRTR